MKSIVVLTGAGISTESGIKTFRASDGLWENHRIEDVASPEGFVQDAELVHNFYNQRRKQLLGPSVAENMAHIALAKLEREFDGELLLVTQNIDDLHERGGSQRVLHMHGELLKKRCQKTDQVSDCLDSVTSVSECECCEEAGNLRPHIVWFGEVPFYMDEIYSALSSCDLFVAIGTSGHVYPAAGFVEIAQQAGAETLEVNLEKSQVASNFDSGLYGKASEKVPQWVESILS